MSVDEILSKYGFTRENWEADPAMVGELIVELSAARRDVERYHVCREYDEYRSPERVDSDCDDILAARKNAK